MLREIVKKGDEVLNKKCHAVTKFDDKLHTLLDDMADTLRDADGVGLAAPQVGILRQVVLVINEDDEIIELINPEIIQTSGEQFGLEGCLSVPGRYGFVKRPMVVRVRAQDRNGNTFEVEDEGLTARCFCHEIDHLSGHLFDELVGPHLHGGGDRADGRRGQRGRGIMRIVFMGTPDFAVPSLKRLISDGYEIVGVFTQPDKPKNRGMKLTPSPVKVVASGA